MAERYSFKLTKDSPHPPPFNNDGTWWNCTTAILKILLYKACQISPNSIKMYVATVLHYGNQHIFETKILLFFQFDTSSNLFLCRLKKNLVYAGLNQWNLLWLSLLLWVESKLRHRVCARLWGMSRDTENYRIFPPRSW